MKCVNRGSLYEWKVCNFQRDWQKTFNLGIYFTAHTDPRDDASRLTYRKSISPLKKKKQTRSIVYSIVRKHICGTIDAEHNKLKAAPQFPELNRAHDPIVVRTFLAQC